MKLQYPGGQGTVFQVKLSAGLGGAVPFQTLNQMGPEKRVRVPTRVYSAKSAVDQYVLAVYVRETARSVCQVKRPGESDATLAYLSRSEEVAPELEACGFQVQELLAVEGFFWTYPHLGSFVEDEEKLASLLEHARMLEKEPSVMGTSAHFLSIVTGKSK